MKRDLIQIAAMVILMAAAYLLENFGHLMF